MSREHDDPRMALRYEHLDGTTTSWPAGNSWDPAGVGVDALDLVQLRALLMLALMKVNAQLDAIGLGS